MASVTISISDADSEMFGYTCIRANNVAKANIPEMLRFSQEHGVRVLIARCDTNGIETVHALEDHGFRLADTLVYSRAAFEKLDELERRLAFPIRSFRSSDVEQIVEVARVLYTDYVGHYHADTRFDRAKVIDGYADWARRSCVDRAIAEEVFVTDDRGRVGGFVTMRLNDLEDGEMVVGGVHPDYTRKGIYRDFLITGMLWCRSKGRRRMVVSTHVNNYTVQRAWAQLGFKQYASYYTFHRWFTD